MHRKENDFQKMSARGSGAQALPSAGVVCALLMGVSVMLSCTDSSGLSPHRGRADELGRIAANLNADLVQMRDLVGLLAGYTHELLTSDKKLEAGFNDKHFSLAGQLLYYKSKNDGGALYVATKYPVNPRKAKRMARLTPFFTLMMRPLVNSTPAIAQAYFNSYDNYSYIFPYFDAVQIIDPGMDVTKFNFYFLADEQHNPERKSVWVGTPYVDPAGLGWMISVIAPVYQGDKLLGVAGTDLTVHTLTEKYLEKHAGNLLIVNHAGQVIATSESAARILHLPILHEHKYIETVKSDTFQPEKFNLLKSSSKPVRAVAGEIITQAKTHARLTMHGAAYTVLAAPIPEVNWTLWQIIAE